jgi:MFS transporter, PHS family, inorganic phosphate transporter
VPGECFPTRYRSTSHGISAASGKIGSIIGQGAIATLRTTGATKENPTPWMDHVLEIYALFMLLGCLSTLLIPETKRKTLEELSGDNDYAASNLEGLRASNGEESGGVLGKKTEQTANDSP